MPILLGIIIASLINGEIPNQTSSLEIFMDGEFNFKIKTYIIDFLSKIYCFKKENILIKDGSKLDQRCKIVNYADLIANKLFKQAYNSWDNHCKKLLDFKPYL